jgi:hypothetical protein
VRGYGGEWERWGRREEERDASSLDDESRRETAGQKQAKGGGGEKFHARLKETSRNKRSDSEGSECPSQDEQIKAREKRLDNRSKSEQAGVQCLAGVGQDWRAGDDASSVHLNLARHPCVHTDCI